MKFDLKPLTRKQLERLRADVDKALERIAETEKKDALRAAEKAARALGYSLEELTGGAVKARTAKADGEKRTPAKPRAKARAKSDGRAKVAPKYRNPNNADETWTGRGRAPKWVEAHLATGGKKEDLAI